MRTLFALILLAAPLVQAEDGPAEKAHPLGPLVKTLQASKGAPFSCKVAEDRVHVEGHGEGASPLWHDPGAESPTTLEVQVSVQSEDGDRGAGLALEIPGGSVIFVLLPGGRVGVYECDGQGAPKPRSVSGFDDLDSTQPHTLQVVREGRTLHFMLDGERASSWGNDRLAQVGKVGVVVLGDAKATLQGYAESGE
ncbi:MAG: hypothetical protein R3F62_01605 [Planctomycetota bacterium]